MKPFTRPSRHGRLRRPGLLGVAVATVAALGGCAQQTVPGEGFPDWEAVERNDEARFEAQLDALAAAITRADPFANEVDTDVAGVAYVHAVFGEDTLDTQYFVAIHGSPPAMYYQQTEAVAGATIDEVHLPGAQYDYYLLGEHFAGLAPTSWVRMPSIYDASTPYELGSLCEVAGFYQACFLHEMIELTAESGADVRRLVSVESDGTVHSQTEITLQALLDTDEIVRIDDDVVAEFPDAMLESLIPVHFWQDAEGNLIKMEMNGVFEGDEVSGDLLMQVGFEVTGLGSAVEVPTLPPEWDVTTIEGDEQITAFWDQVWELK